MLHIIFKHSQTWTPVDGAQQGGGRLITACAGGSSSLFKGGPVTQEQVWKQEASAFIISCSLSGNKCYIFWSKCAFYAFHAVTSPDIAIKTRNTTTSTLVAPSANVAMATTCHYCYWWSIRHLFSSTQSSVSCPPFLFISPSCAHQRNPEESCSKRLLINR